MASIIRDTSGKRLPVGANVPHEYEGLRVGPYQEVVIGPGAAKAMAVTCDAGDIETMVRHALIRYRHHPRKAVHYVVHVDIGGVAGAVAPVIGKQPPDIHMWILDGELLGLFPCKGERIFLSKRTSTFQTLPFQQIPTSPCWRNLRNPSEM